MSEQQIVEQRNEELAAERRTLLFSRELDDPFDCPICKAHIEEADYDLWEINGIRLGHEPVKAFDGEYLCSQECLSQYVYNHAPECVQILMRSLGRMVADWQHAVRIHQQGDANLKWALEHSFLTHLVSHNSLELADYEMRQFADLLVGPDAMANRSDEPSWYFEAIGEIEPKVDPLKVLRAVYDWADQREDITNTGHANDAMQVKAMIHEQLGDFIYREWKPNALRPAEIGGAA